MRYVETSYILDIVRNNPNATLETIATIAYPNATDSEKIQVKLRTSNQLH